MDIGPRNKYAKPSGFISNVPFNHYTKKVMAILIKFQFSCNYSVNINFDMRYLGNLRSDFLLIFLLVELFRIISKLKILCPTPSGLQCVVETRKLKVFLISFLFTLGHHSSYNHVNCILYTLAKKREPTNQHIQRRPAMFKDIYYILRYLISTYTNVYTYIF